MIPIFIGYDPKEPAAFHTCVSSIIRNSSQPVSIIPLALNTLSNYTEHHTDGSNQFIYSRFLVPYLTGYYDWAIFIDGDMIVQGDIAELWNMRNYQYDIMVVKHDYQTKMPIKYLGAKNEDYPRKNWSSVILWNCGSQFNKILTPDFVQRSSGARLHRFTWLDDDKIGELPIEWNWLDIEYDYNPNAKLIHYTLGSPCFKEFSNLGTAQIWKNELEVVNYCQQKE